MTPRKKAVCVRKEKRHNEMINEARSAVIALMRFRADGILVHMDAQSIGGGIALIVVVMLSCMGFEKRQARTEGGAKLPSSLCKTPQENERISRVASQLYPLPPCCSTPELNTTYITGG